MLALRTPPPDGTDDDLSIHDVMGELRDTTKAVSVRIRAEDDTETLTVTVDGYVTYKGDIAGLLDYNPATRKKMMNILREDGWIYRHRYDIDRIGHQTLPPIKILDELWERW